jgi:hypothetical protein
MMFFLELWKKLEELKSLEDKPEIIILILCIPALLCIPQILSKFITNINDLFDQVSEREYLKTKEIYNDSLTNELINNVAKRRLDTFQFRKMTGIRTSSKLTKPLDKLIEDSQNENLTKSDIRKSINFLVKGHDDLPRIRPEKRNEKLWRYFLNFYGCFLLCLLIPLLYILIRDDLQFELKINGLQYVLYICIVSSTLFSQTAYFFSNKRLKKEIFKIKGYPIPKEKKRKSWFNILKRKGKSVVTKFSKWIPFLIFCFRSNERIEKESRIIKGYPNPQKKKRKSKKIKMKK